MERLLYSRYQDGSFPVYMRDDGQYEIHKPHEKVICSSARQLIINLTGHPQARNWTFDRYFKQGIWSPPQRDIQPIVPVLDLFEPGGIVTDAGIIVPGKTKSTQNLTINPKSLQAKGNLKLTCAEQALIDMQKFPNGPILGINLDERGHEVAKLLFAGFKNWIFGSGYDPQEVLQEVYKGILIRNKGTCPFDVRKASFGHYVHQVCRCILSNYHRKESRRAKAEMVGMKMMKDGVWKEADAAEGLAEKHTKDPRKQSTMTDDLSLMLLSRPTRENRLALRVVPLLGQGYTHGDMAEMLDISRTSIGKAMVTIREVARLCGYYPPSELETH